MKCSHGNDDHCTIPPCGSHAVIIDPPDGREARVLTKSRGEALVVRWLHMLGEGEYVGSLAASTLAMEIDNALASTPTSPGEVEALVQAARRACERLDTYQRENREAATPQAVYRAYRDLYDALAASPWREMGMGKE